MATTAHMGVPAVSRPGPPVATPTGATELGALYASLALLGIASLAIAAASSLLPWLNAGEASAAGAGLPALWPWAAGLASAAYGLAALLYGLASLRSGRLPRVEAVQIVLAVAGAMHLTALLAGLWRMPETGRTFDATLAALLVLELSVLATLGWRRNAAMRRRPGRAAQHKMPAAAVVGTLFVASIFVAALTTAGMAASTAGELAVPHSGHGGSHEAPAVPENVQQLKQQGHHH